MKGSKPWVRGQLSETKSFFGFHVNWRPYRVKMTKSDPRLGLSSQQPLSNRLTILFCNSLCLNCRKCLLKAVISIPSPVRASFAVVHRRTNPPDGTNEELQPISGVKSIVAVDGERIAQLGLNTHHNAQNSRIHLESRLRT